MVANEGLKLPVLGNPRVCPPSPAGTWLVTPPCTSQASGHLLFSAQRGLRAGDVITAVNRRPVRSLAELNAIASNNDILFLLVQRGDRALMLQVR